MGREGERLGRQRKGWKWKESGGEARDGNRVEAARGKGR